MKEQTILLRQETPLHERIEATCDENRKTPEYLQAREEVNRIWGELTAKAPEDIKQILLKYEAAILALTDIEARACYIKGLNDAAKIA